jgi:hypothetical protein
MVRRTVLVVALAAVVGSLLAPAAASAEVAGSWDHRSLAVNGTYTVLVGQFGGDGADDLLFYAPGSAADSLWIGHDGARGSATFTKVGLTINGTYRPIVGDFGGDDYDDVLWYAPGGAPDPLWVSADTPTAFDTTRKLAVSGTFTPIALHDRSAAGRKDDVLWYAPGPAKDYLYHFAESTTGTYTVLQPSISGSFQVVPGDWNADDRDDVFLYAPGSAPDYRWLATTSGSFTSGAVNQGGSYRPVPIADPAGDGILWWGDGSAAEAYWRSDGRDFRALPVPKVDVTATVVPGGIGTALVIVPDAVDGLFSGTASGGAFFSLAAPGHDIGAGIRPIVGDFDDDGYIDVVFYGPGSRPDQLWYSVPPASAASLAGSPRALVAAGSTPSR